MTREHKLAIIIGFTLVLVVGVLLSDHLSTSKQANLGGPDVAEGAPTVQKDEVAMFGNRLPVAPVGDAGVSTVAATSERPLGGALAGGTQTVPGGGGGGGGTGVETIEMGGKPSTLGAVVKGVGDEFRGAIEDLGNGRTTAPAASLDQLPSGTTHPATQGAIEPEQSEPIPVSNSGLDGAGSNTDALLGIKKNEKKDVTPVEPKVGARDIKKHQIAEGDTFWKIAKAEYGDAGLAEKLKAFNKDRIGKSGQLRVGASLLIPEKSVLKGEKTASAEKPNKFQGVPNPEKIEKAKSDSGKKATTYKVQRGDTLGKIAAKLLGSAGRVDDILEANKSLLDDSDSIVVGMELKIPAR